MKINRIPIAISYLPKMVDYLPSVVGAIRHHLGDWPIHLVTQEQYLPPERWLVSNKVEPLTDWSHSEGANKQKRLWEHQEVLASRFDRWISWHDDMLLMKPVDDPEQKFALPIVRHMERERPNKEMNAWHRLLWETLAFFRIQSMRAPNPILHTPRTIYKSSLESIPSHWDRSRLVFEATYLLWHWNNTNQTPILDPSFRFAVFQNTIPPLDTICDSDPTILVWGKKINNTDWRAELVRHQYPVDFE